MFVWGWMRPRADLNAVIEKIPVSIRNETPIVLITVILTTLVIGGKDMD
jgi:multisubunit Na+/H+ antiporter MnhE subunit